MNNMPYILQYARMGELRAFMEMLHLKYTAEEKTNLNHPSQSYLPITQFDTHNRPLNLRTRKALLPKSLFYKYS